MRSYDKAGPEPRLDDVLSDPIVHAVMQRDGVGRHELLSIVAAARARLQSDVLADVTPWRSHGRTRVPRWPRSDDAVSRCCA